MRPGSRQGLQPSPYAQGAAAAGPRLPAETADSLPADKTPPKLGLDMKAV